MGYLDVNQEFNLYKDISQRTGGEIYIGVVGPVRTGKSTFIKVITGVHKAEEEGWFYLLSLQYPERLPEQTPM